MCRMMIRQSLDFYSFFGVNCQSRVGNPLYLGINYKAVIVKVADKLKLTGDFFKKKHPTTGHSH